MHDGGAVFSPRTTAHPCRQSVMATALTRPDLSDTVVLIGVPTGAGSGRPDARGGPAALRRAGLGLALERAGWHVVVRRDLVPRPATGATIRLSHGRAHDLAGVARWSREVAIAASEVLAAGDRPIFLGGDHSVAIGSIGAAARHWGGRGRPLFVLWLDAHADFNTPATTLTGNLHGMALAMLCGAFGTPAMFGLADFPRLDRHNLLLVGTRSVDPMEGVLLRNHGIEIVHADDLPSPRLDTALHRLLEDVDRAHGVLHVSLDLDVLDPAAAPGVATPVPRGCAMADIMRILTTAGSSGCVASLDIVEHIPKADDSGRTANAAVALASALFDTRTRRPPVAGLRQPMQVEND